MGIKPEHASVCERGGMPGTESGFPEGHCSGWGGVGGGGQSTHVHIERDPLILWEILVALGVGEFFLGQD